MNIEQFIQSTEALHSRLADLYQTASVLPWIPPELLPQAFKELYSTSKMVQLAAEELYLQNEELIETRNWLETERQRYQDLFEFAPDGYLVTNTEGIIQEANLAAAQLLNVSRQLLVGKPIVNFVRLEEREPFRSELNQLRQSDRVRELVVRLQQNNGEDFDAAFTVAVVRNQQGNANSLRWLLRNINERQQKKTELINNNSDLIEERPVHKHTKGETILLNPLVVWYVRQGLVKLNTFCETGEEILIGLATQDMVFGSNMTSLPIYQATALCDVELSSIYVAEIAVNPMLSHILLPKINQRLQQTESFLVIAGKRRVEERLYHLLQLLKQQIGEPVPEGIRLSVRLTHEDIASACCTTRVTITRLMGKLQQQGLISFDSKKYIILKE
ncbi:PAS domain-containing protein [Nodularia spumigena]|uniref:Global nitrogen regulator n=2 Tax=Nodularia spumigena TaxID=70799 RepID=A0A2S0Q6X5_NODSP|nr:PAS domain-containing protein [Nodularia spumigena]AHJ28054.1 transcriptional regulator [Nodularia spumigena CCY9414]AVZ30144.1 global nitrogen regulator [Nodularia spumigena UHCC 0039]EAW44245.1 transcriptional regulator [Nodularia spumigena CCY9414]MEA5523843.1 PAS domain-containing protein [Nodularia spumigena UHCC 0143]MEA5555807.1 PAS domain-containing protein [Nodularia spumigena CH309]